MRSALVLATVLAACTLFAVVAVGCLGKPQFECGGPGDCLQGGIQGTCQPTKFCSFPDSSCPITGQRYGDLSGPQANQCVGPPIDAPLDAFVPDTYVHDARECFGGSGAYQLCFAMMPPMGNVILAGTLDTDTDARCMAVPAGWTTAGQPDSCLILGKTITIATVAVTGAKPLVVLGDTIQLTGTLDVASHRGQPAGPAAPAPSPTCAAFPQAPLDNIQGGGGGAGGSFKTKGGDGGVGKNASLAGLAPPAVANPTVLRAGCSGQAGAGGVAATGTPGSGGGAVFLTASRITFAATGVINASGAGAIGGGNLSGGSGGGSGGMIVLHAAETITGTTGAKVLANGGGAASGANAIAGGSGNDPSPTTPTTPATGGMQNNAGDGGAGFAGTTQATIGQGASGNRDSGGGGGGGGGYVQTNVALMNITSSPAATVVP